MVGALLMTLAAVGVLAAYAGAGDGPAGSLVVATRSIRAGETIDPGALVVVDAEVPGTTSARAFASVEEVAGRVALGPIGDGEVVQASVVTDQVAPGGHEIALALPRDQIAVSRLKAGERVDVFVTYDERTEAVVQDVAVVELAAGGDGGLTSDRSVTVVVAVPSADQVAALVHALRTGEVTVVRATFGSDDHVPAVYEPAAPDGADD